MGYHTSGDQDLHSLGGIIIIHMQVTKWQPQHYLQHSMDLLRTNEERLFVEKEDGDRGIKLFYYLESS